MNTENPVKLKGAPIGMHHYTSEGIVFDCPRFEGWVRFRDGASMKGWVTWDGTMIRIEVWDDEKGVEVYYIPLTSVQYVKELPST